MNDETLLAIGALYHFAFALFHLAFWKLFRWREELAKLSRVNRGVMQILNLRITYLACVFAALSWWFPRELAESSIGRYMLAAIALFWATRAAEQIGFFGLKNPISLGFFAVFVAGALIYATPLVR